MYCWLSWIISLALMSKKCFRWVIVISQCVSSVVQRQQFALKAPPTQLGQLTRNLTGSIWVTYRSKIAKIVAIGNPRWPLWPPSSKSMFRFYSWTKRTFSSNLVGSIGATCRLKIANIVPIGNQRWPSYPSSGKSILRFFWTKRPKDSKLGWKFLGNLVIKIAKIGPIGNPW